MNKVLLKNLKYTIAGFNRLKTFYSIFIIGMIGLVSNAQCIGPYAGFESSFLNTIPPGFTYTGSSVFTNTNSANSRSGGALFQHSTTNADATIVLPTINNPKTISFYVRKSSAIGVVMSYALQFSTDNGVTWFSVLPGTNLINGISVTGVTPSLSTAVTISTWDLVSATFNSNVPTCKIRIADTRVAAVAGVLWIDDISWICNKSDGTASTGYPENPIIVPGQVGVGTPTNCVGGTVVVDPTAIYNFYDNGANSDSYNLNQTNQVTFTPSGVGYAAGDRVRIQFISYTGALTTDKIEVWDNNGTTLNGTTNLLTHTATTLPAITTYVSTISSDGSITIKFSSDAAANAAGFNIKVDCVRCAPPTALTATTVSSTSGTLTWTSSGATNYDLYYNTTGVLPNGYVTPSVSNIATNSYTITGLATSQIYYVWVRSKCSSAPDSYSSWTPSINFTTIDCSAFVISTSPSTATQTLCLNATSTALTVAASGGTGYTYQWFSNASNSNLGGTLLSGATSSSYTPITTSAGTLYYYCDVTSVLPSCTKTSNVSGAVVITTVPSIAPIAAGATGPSSSSFTANWSTVAGATGYYIDVATDAGFTTYVSGYNNLNVLNVLTYGVTGLTPGVTYYYRVRAYNTCGSSTSSNIITQATVGITYCTISAPATTTTSVNSFSTTGGITNITNNTTGFTTGGYANYTAQSCSQYPASLVNYSITSLRTDSTDQTFFYYIWIDWNNNGSFNDAGETILATTSYQPGPFTGTFSIPNTQAPGSYRMRVSTSWIGANTSCAINASGRGEMEDYTVVVVPVPPCAPSTPSALTTASVTATGAIIIWTDAAMTPNSIYNYYYNTTGIAPLVGTTPSGTVTGANSATLTGLTLGNTYYFWVRSNCGTPSAWVGSSNFTTINQDVVNMTNGSITSCNVKFYDSAGPVADYSDNEIYTYTFYPSSPTSKLKVVFNSFTTENRYDGLSIYNGNSTAAPLISSGLAAGNNTTTCPAGSFYGTNSPGTIISTASDGSLTFQFSSDGSVNYAGWDAIITCVTVPIITSFTPTSVCAGVTPTVTLTGTNFTGATSVKFNGTTAIYTINSNTSITTTLPVGATTGYITVANAQATGTSSTVFTVNPVPSTPNAGSPVTICSGTSTTLAATASGAFTTTVLNQDFNAGPWPSGWTRTINGGFSPGDFRTSSEFVSGGNTWVGNGFTGFCSYFYSFLISAGVAGDMISPAMDMSTYSSSTLTFWLYNSAGSDSLSVYANNNGGAYSQVGTTYTSYGAWTQITISLNAFVGSGFNAVTLKFTGKGDGGSSNFGVDDIEVTADTTPINTWSPATGLSATNILNPVASPTVTTNYTLTSTYGNGCSTNSSVAISVNPKPTITVASAATSVCYSNSSQTTSLTYSASSGSLATYSIIWNSSPSAGVTTVSNAAFPATGPISVTVPGLLNNGTNNATIIVKNTAGCVSASYTFTVDILPSPAVTITTNTRSVCYSTSAQTVLFPYTGANTLNSYDVTWNALPANTFATVSNVTFPSSSGDITVAIPAGTLAGTYTGTVTPRNAGCGAGAAPRTITVIVSQPSITPATSGATPVCINTSAQITSLTFSNPISNPISYSIVWNALPVNSFVPVTDAVLTTTPITPITINVPANAVAATYTGNIIVKNAGGCSSTSLSFSVKVNAKPTVASSFVLDPICVSSTAQTASLSYSASTNAPTSYSIDWNAAANTAGLIDQGSTAYTFINGDDTISNINIPANLPPNRYTGTINIMNANGCTNSFPVTLYIGKVWNGITSSDWATATNWYPNGEPTSGDYCVYVPSGTPNNPIISADAFSGDLTINTGATVTVNSGFVLEILDFVKTDGTLTVNDDASLVQVNDVPNSGVGSMVYKRNVTGLNGYDYIYWSSPVVSQTLASLYTSPSIGPRYFWDTLVNNGNGTGGNTGQGNWANALSTMDVGRGYIVRASSSYGWNGNLTSTFTGTPNNGTLTLPLHRGSYQGAPYIGVNGMSITNKDDNHNLIGNPYPSALDAISFLTLPSNASKIEGFVYLWTHGTTPSSTSNPFYSTYSTNYYLSDYLIYNSLGSSSIPTFNGKIAGGQGFFVTMLDGNTVTDSSELVTFDNTMRSAAYGNSQFYKSSQVATTQTTIERHRIWIDLIDSNNNSTRTLVGYATGATNGKDRMYDAFTKVGAANIIYSRSGDENLVIQGRGLPFDENDQVSIGFNATTNGNYTIAIGTVDGLFEQGQPIYLEDKVLNIIYDLRQAPYNFTTAAGTFNDRFILRYTNNALSVNQFNLTNVAATVIKGQLQIKANTAIDNVHVFDITGKLVKIYNPAEKTTDLREDFSYEKGVYFAKIKLIGGDLVTQKIMN